MKERILTLNEELKGETYTSNIGELKVNGFTSYEEYEELYYYLLEELKSCFNGDFVSWYKKTNVRYCHFRRKSARRYNKYIAQEKPTEEHNLYEQLAVIRWFIYKRANSYAYFKEGKFDGRANE